MHSRYAMYDSTTGIAKWGYTNESRSSSSWHASPCISLNSADFHSNIKDDDESGWLANRRRSWTTRLVEKKRRNYYLYYIFFEARKYHGAMNHV